MNQQKLRFKIDENLPTEAANIFVENGFNAESVFYEGLKGAPDNKIIKICKQEERILVTLDLDFSDIRIYPPGSVPGIIILRISDHSIKSVLTIVKRIITKINTENPVGKLWIVSDTNIRIRS